MKSKGKLYRNLFIGGLILIILIALASRYLPYSKIIRVAGSEELSFADTTKRTAGQPNSLSFDFEVPRGKEVPKGIIMGNAHSGNYSAKAFGKNAFTPAMEKTAGELGKNKLKFISVSAWIYVAPGSDPVNGALVLAASNNVGVNIAWKGIGLKDPMVPRGKWFKMSGQFELNNEKFSDDTRLQMYFWNNSNTDIYVDDYYLVYGGPTPRKGDTTYVDLTKGPYQSRFNYPPFPVRFLRMAEIAGMQGVIISQGPGKVGGMLMPSDPMISGLFLSGNSSRDVLFTLPSVGKPLVYAWCPESNSFRKSVVELPVATNRSPETDYMLKGKFLAGESEQLLYMGEKSCFLYQFSSRNPVCHDGNVVKADLLWQSVNFEGMKSDPLKPLLAGDFDGNGLSEILSVDQGGNWKIYSFKPGRGKEAAAFVLTAEGREKLADWSFENGKVQLNAGHFIPAQAGTAILAVSENSQGKYAYSLRMYNPRSKQFVSVFNAKYGNYGRIVGIDSLRTSDLFFCGNFGQNASPMVLRYNREWRYDMKEISFSDSTYHIIDNIDFAGYPEDHNPKYYEVLKLIPGRFTGSQASFIVIGRNCKSRDNDGKDCKEYEDLPELPNFISLYSFVNE